MDSVMEAPMERRVSVATGWASTRIALLDREELYEESYAITQEFREWITCLGENNKMLQSSVMAVPLNHFKRRLINEQAPSDHQLEI